MISERASAYILYSAVNFLLLVNGQTSSIKLVEDYIKNGERKNVVVDIPGAPDPRGLRKPIAYPVGFYVYTKVSEVYLYKPDVRLEY